MLKLFYVLIIFMCTAYSSEPLIVQAINQNVGNFLITPDNSKIILETRTLKENETKLSVFDVSTLRQLFVFDNLNSYARSISTTNNRLTLASHNDIRQYDLRNGSLINKIDVNYGQILVSPNGEMAVCFERFYSTIDPKMNRSQATVWDNTQKKQIYSINFQESTNYILPIAFSKDSQLIIMEGNLQQDSFLAVFDIQNKKEIFRYNNPVYKKIFISPDNKTLFFRTLNPSLMKAFNLANGKELLSFPDINDVKFFPTQDKFLLLNRDTMKLFDYPNMKELESFDHQCFNTYYGKIDILTDDGKYLCERKDSFELQSLYDHRLSQKILAYENPNLFDFSVSGDKSLLVTVDGYDGDNGISVYKLKPELLKVGSIDRLSGVTAIASNENHTKLYVAGRYSLWMYDLEDPSKNKYLKTSIYNPISIVRGEEKNILYIADGGYNSSVHKFNIDMLKFVGSYELSRATHTDVGTSIFLSLDKQKIYIGLRADKKVREFDIHTFEILNEYTDDEINTDQFVFLRRDDIGWDVKLNPMGGLSVIKNSRKIDFYGFNSGEWITIVNDTKYLLSDKSMAQYIYYKDGNPIDSSQGRNSYE